MDKLTNVKVNLRGLLISCPSGMTIKGLENDYREIIGENIPFKIFGFNRADLFLKSLKDTLTLIGTGPYAKVEAVTVKSNAHIKKMVSVQKKTKKRKFVKSYNQNNNLQRNHPKPKVVSPQKPSRQSKPALQPLMNTKQILKPQNYSNYRQSSAPQYYNSSNSYQQTHNFQNGYQQQQYVPQQYMNPQQYYGQQHAHVYNPQVFQSQIQGYQNFNTAELMRIRQIIQAELYYLRTQNQSNGYRNFY